MSQPERKEVRYLSLRLKLLMGFTILFSVTFAAAFYWFYNFATDQAITRITEDLISTMRAAVDGIDGDQLQLLYEESAARGDNYTDDPRYRQQVGWLETVHNIEPRATLYTYAAGDKPNEFILLTSYGPDPFSQEAAAFPQPLVVDHTEAMSSGLITTTLLGKARAGCTFGTRGCVLEPYQGDLGQWVSAFSPVKNSSGKVVAALGTEFEASHARFVQDSIRAHVVVAFLLTYPLSVALVYLLSRYFTLPIVSLTRSAGHISDGDYEESLKQLSETSSYRFFADETTRLSEVVQFMVGKVVQREQLLRKQVEVLRIEIDEAKRQKDVGNIVETDFFRDLQKKARDMRKRSNQQELAADQLPDNTESRSA